MSNFQSVKLFMQTFGQEVKSKSEFPSERITKLRYNLIKEELDEFGEAVKNKDLKEVADSLTDILYVTYGAGHAFGINLDECFEEVQKSNMSKLGEDGKPIYNEQGKDQFFSEIVFQSIINMLRHFWVQSKHRSGQKSS